MPESLLCGSLVMLGGCFLSADLSETEFLCAQEPVCPQGLACVDGRCVAAEEGGDDTDGGAGSDDGEPPVPEFAFRQKIEIDNLARGELVDFPVMIALDDQRIDYGALRPDGLDLQFLDPDGTVLAHDIERWDPGGKSIAWVRVPLIDAGSDGDFIWMYYGEPGLELAEDEALVWSRYEAVYHLDGDGREIEDASAREYDGVAIGSQSVPGVIGLGQSFDGLGQHIDLGGERDFARAAPGLTIEAWVNPQVAQRGVVFGASIPGADTSRVELRHELEQTLRGGARTQDVGELQAAVTGETLPLDTWSWVAVVCDFEAGEVSIYIDDHLSITASGLLFDAATPDAPSGRAAIGANESLDSDFFAGLLDEVRLAPAAMPPDWVAAQNASMRDQLLRYGAAEAL
ncbi:MAG TPA: DUF2341 domain-containing protein [Kofleriaceae bacterium]|nr:DUF2341 domain-containing protein [Kofleriaceae bacterium]